MINPITTLIDYLDSSERVATLTAERDAALQQVAALEAELAQVRQRGDFYFDMVQANDAWARARREREIQHGR